MFILVYNINGVEDGVFVNYDKFIMANNITI